MYYAQLNIFQDVWTEQWIIKWKQCCHQTTLYTIAASYLFLVYGYVFIRSPSSMAISWSYVRQNFPFCEKKKTSYPLFKKTQLFVVKNFFIKKDAISFHSHCFLYPPGYPPGYLPRYPPGYPPGYPLGYPPGYLMLPNLTNQFIKLSDGDLQCEWNSDIFYWVWYTYNT